MSENADGKPATPAKRLLKHASGLLLTTAGTWALLQVAEIEQLLLQWPQAVIATILMGAALLYVSVAWGVHLYRELDRLTNAERIRRVFHRDPESGIATGTSGHYKEIRVCPMCLLGTPPLIAPLEHTKVGANEWLCRKCHNGFETPEYKEERRNAQARDLDKLHNRQKR